MQVWISCLIMVIVVHLYQDKAAADTSLLSKIQNTISNPERTADEDLLLNALELKGILKNVSSTSDSCSDLLPSFDPLFSVAQIQTQLKHAPPPVYDAIRNVFFLEQRLTPGVQQYLNDLALRFDIRIEIKDPQLASLSQTLERKLKRYLKASHLPGFKADLLNTRIVIKSFNHEHASDGRPLNSDLIQIVYWDGEVQEFNFQNVDYQKLFRALPEWDSLQLYAAALSHRGILVSQATLNHEVQEFRAYLVRLAPTVAPEYQDRIAAIMRQLHTVRRGPFVRKRTSLAMTFVNYLHAKADLIDLTQDILEYDTEQARHSHSPPPIEIVSHNRYMYYVPPRELSDPLPTPLSHENWSWYFNPQALLMHPFFAPSEKSFAPLILTKIFHKP